MEKEAKLYILDKITQLIVQIFQNKIESLNLGLEVLNTEYYSNNHLLNSDYFKDDDDIKKTGLSIKTFNENENLKKKICKLILSSKIRDNNSNKSFDKYESYKLIVLFHETIIESHNFTLDFFKLFQFTSLQNEINDSNYFLNQIEDEIIDLDSALSQM